MSTEGFPTGAAEQLAEESLARPDGSLNEEYLANNYGLSAAEAQQNVGSGMYKGTVLQMLLDDRCPVGKILKDAYQEKGLEGLEEKTSLLHMMDSGFKIEISAATREREQLKKKLSITVIRLGQ